MRVPCVLQSVVYGCLLLSFCRFRPVNTTVVNYNYRARRVIRLYTRENTNDVRIKYYNSLFILLYNIWVYEVQTRMRANTLAIYYTKKKTKNNFTDLYTCDYHRLVTYIIFVFYLLYRLCINRSLERRQHSAS